MNQPIPISDMYAGLMFTNEYVAFGSLLGLWSTPLVHLILFTW